MPVFVCPWGSCDPKMLFLEPWDARIGDGPAGVLPEEPGQVRRAVLRVTIKIVDLWAAEIAEKQGTAIGVAAHSVVALPADEGKEWIKFRTGGWNGTADPVPLAQGF